MRELAGINCVGKPISHLSLEGLISKTAEERQSGYTVTKRSIINYEKGERAAPPDYIKHLFYTVYDKVPIVDSVRFKKEIENYLNEYLIVDDLFHAAELRELVERCPLPKEGIAQDLKISTDELDAILYGLKKPTHKQEKRIKEICSAAEIMAGFKETFSQGINKFLTKLLS